jgi:hypothetical protein
MQNNLKNRRNNMKNSPMKKNKFETQVHRDVTGIEKNGWTEGGGEKENERTCTSVYPPACMALCE